MRHCTKSLGIKALRPCSYLLQQRIAIWMNGMWVTNYYSRERSSSLVVDCLCDTVVCSDKNQLTEKVSRSTQSSMLILPAQWKLPQYVRTCDSRYVHKFINFRRVCNLYCWCFAECAESAELHFVSREQSKSKRIASLDAGHDPYNPNIAVLLFRFANPQIFS